MHRPPTLATVAEATPATNGVSFVHGYSGPQGVTRMVVAHFFESGQRRRLRWGPSRERTANGRRSSAGQHRVHSCDRRKAWAGPRRLGPGVQGSPQREPALPTETAREAEYARRKVESSFWSGGWIAAQLRPPGTGCSPANGTPEELRRLARPCVLSIAFTAPVLL